MNKEFWKALLIRTVKTWCQAFVGAIGGTATILSDVNWKVALSGATLAAIICFFWNLGTGLPEVKLTDTLYALDNDPFDEDDDFEDGDE
jgi:hypothetical protein